MDGARIVQAGRTTSDLIGPGWFYRAVLNDALVLTIDGACFDLTGGLNAPAGLLDRSGRMVSFCQRSTHIVNEALARRRQSHSRAKSLKHRHT